jgi:hypothetical protein
MFSTDISKNIKAALKQDRIMEDASALLVPLTYIGVPTLLDFDGWAGLGAGFLATYLLGAAFNIPGMTSGAIAVASTHIAYSQFHDEITNLLGREPSNFQATGFADDVAGPSYPDGQRVLSYQYPTDRAGISDSRFLAPGVSDSSLVDTDSLMDEVDEDFEYAF